MFGVGTALLVLPSQGRLRSQDGQLVFVVGNEFDVVEEGDLNLFYEAEAGRITSMVYLTVTGAPEHWNEVGASWGTRKLKS